MEKVSTLVFWVSVIALALPPIQGRAEVPVHTKVYENRFDRIIEIDMWSQLRIGKAAGGERFLGLFGARDTVYQELENLPEHRLVRLRFDLIVALTWDGESQRGDAPDTWALSVTGGPLLMLTSFCNPLKLLDPDRIARGDAALLPKLQSFPDEFPLMYHPAGTGSTPIDLGIQFRPGKLEVVHSRYPIDIIFPHTGSELSLQYTGNLTSPATDEAWGIDNVIIETIDRETSFGEEEMAQLWEKLRGQDPVAANAAIWKCLSGDPEVSAFIEQRWQAMKNGEAEELDDDQQRRLIELARQLNSDAFVTRQQAGAELMKLGEQALPTLRSELAKSDDPGLRRALQTTIGKIQKRFAGSEKKRHLDLVATRVAHLRRIAQTHANGYKVTSSAQGLREFPNDPIGAAADGYFPANSNLQVVPRFTWSPKEGTEEWLQYEFPKPKQISMAEVFWFEPYEDRSCLPTSWKVSYRSAGGAWKDVEAKTPYDLAPHQFNRVDFEAVEASAVRLTVQLPEITGGVYEFRVSDQATETKRK